MTFRKDKVIFEKVQKQIALIIAAVLVILIIAAVAFLAARPKTAPTTTGQEASGVSRGDRLVRSDSYQQGDANAPVTIVEFVDFQCEACAYVYPIATRIFNEYGGKVRLVIRYWPLSDQHKNAQAAAIAVEAAGECQVSRFWEMSDRLLTSQSQWSAGDNPWVIFVGYAKDLDCVGFPTDFAVASNKFADKITRDRDDAKALSVKGVPNFFINGVNYGYIQTYEEFKEKFEKELALCGRTTMTEDDIDNGRLLCSFN